MLLKLIELGAADVNAKIEDVAMSLLLEGSMFSGSGPEFGSS